MNLEITDRNLEISLFITMVIRKIIYNFTQFIKFNYWSMIIVSILLISNFSTKKDEQQDQLMDIFTSLAKNETSKIYLGGLTRKYEPIVKNLTHIVIHQVFIYRLQ